MGKGAFIVGLIFLLTGLIFIPMVVYYEWVMEQCLIENGSWCDYGIPGVIVFLIVCLVIGVILVIKSRAAFKEILKGAKAKIKEARRKKTKAEKKKKKIEKTKRTIKGARQFMIFSIIWIIAFSAILIGLCIAILPLPDAETNPSTYLAAIGLAVVAILLIIGILAFFESLFEYQRKKADLKKLEKS